MNEIAVENRKCKVMIVDDEQLARTLLADYVSKIPQLELVASCSNAIEALPVLNNQKIDILLTDIEMPDVTGVEFVEQLPYRPCVIFTTAYSQYALDGFDLAVVDYLLKPISFARFFKAIEKALKLIQIKSSVQDISHIQNVNKYTDNQSFIVVRADRKLYKINFEDLLYVEGQGEYVTFHTKQRNITALYSMKNLLDELPAKLFMRIHKSYIVALSYIEIIDANSVTVAGMSLPIGPSFRDAVHEYFN